MSKHHISGLIPERCKEVNIRVYTREDHLTYRVQHGFRELLKQINSRLQDLPNLEAESMEQIPDTATLLDTASKAEQRPIADASRNPFLGSPTLKSSPQRSTYANSSPIRRLLESSEGLSIPNSEIDKRMKKVRDEEFDRDNRKKTRKSFPFVD